MGAKDPVDGNDYSVNPRAIGRFVDWIATPALVAVTCQDQLVATHERVWSSGATVTDPEHKATARKMRAEPAATRQRPGTRAHPDGHVVAIRALPDYDALFGVTFDPTTRTFATLVSQASIWALKSNGDTQRRFSRAPENHCGAGGGSPRPAVPAHSMSDAAEIRTDPSGSRKEASSPRAISALTQGTVSPSQRAAWGRVSAACPSIRITGPTVPATGREVQDLCTSICTSSPALVPRWCGGARWPPAATPAARRAWWRPCGPSAGPIQASAGRSGSTAGATRR